MRTLYELSQQMQELIDMLENVPADDAEREASETAIRDSLEMVEMDWMDKIDDYGFVIRQMTADQKTISDEIKRLQAKKASIDSGLMRIKNRLRDCIAMTGETKAKTALFTFTVRNNAPSTIIDDYDRVPKKFLIKQPAKVNTEEVKAYLKEHDGKASWAHLETTTSLMVK